MIYLILLVFAVIMRHYGVAYREEMAELVIEVILSFLLFTDVIKMRFSVLVHYHRLPIITAGIAYFVFGVVLLYTLPGETLQWLPPLLIIACYDFRVYKETRRSSLIPPKIKQFLSLDGLMRSLLVAFFLSPMLPLDWTSGVYAFLLGIGIGIIVIGGMRLIGHNSLLLIVPFGAYFCGRYFVGEGVITTLTCGALIGNLSRPSCAWLTSFYNKYYSVFFQGIILVFGLKFGNTLLSIFSFELLFITLLLLFVINAVIVSVIFLFMRMQWQSMVFCSLSNIPGALGFALTILAFESNQGFIPGMLSLSLILHTLILPKLTKWYGSIFTGRDTCSKLEEHKPTIEMPY